MYYTERISEYRPLWQGRSILFRTINLYSPNGDPYRLPDDLPPYRLDVVTRSAPASNN